MRRLPRRWRTIWHLRGGRAGGGGALAHVADVGGDLRGALRRLADAAHDLLHGGVLLLVDVERQLADVGVMALDAEARRKLRREAGLHTEKNGGVLIAPLDPFGRSGRLGDKRNCGE